MERPISEEQLPISSNGEVDEKRRELLGFGLGSALSLLLPACRKDSRRVISSCKDTPDCENADEIQEKYKQVFEVVGEMESEFRGIDLKETVLCLVQKYMKGDAEQTVNGLKRPRGRTEVTAEGCAKIIAHNIVLDIQKKLPWSLDKLSKDELRALFEFDYFYTQVKSKSARKYPNVDHIPSDPKQIFEFMQKNELIKENHEKTIYAVIDWFRDYATHDTGQAMLRDHIKRYGHEGYPTTMDLLSQPEKFGRLDIMGCHGSVRLLKNMLASIGIPANTDTTFLEKMAHARLDFPSIGKSAMHGDDLHMYKRSKFLRPDGRLAEVPAEAILVPNVGLDGEQGLRYLDHMYRLEETYMPDATLYRYASVKAMGPAAEAGGSLEREMAILGEKRVRDFRKKMDEEIQKISGGDYAKAAKILKDRVIWPSVKPIL